MTEALLDAAFLARLERLALRSRTRAGGQRAGAHSSRRRGQSLEFVDHREYVPGDDIRHLDWHLIGRLDRLFIKLFEAREDRTVALLLDRSTSMSGAKWTAARQAAAHEGDDYDDSLDAFGVHGVGGTLGALLTGVFASKHLNGNHFGLLDGNPGQMVPQIVSILATAVFAVIGTIIILKVLDATMGLRVSQDDEVRGLDVSQHGEEGYIFL